MKGIKIRESAFNNLFKNILSKNYCEDWNCYETNDDSVNPIVHFETNKWKTLFIKIQSWLDSNYKKGFNVNISENDLEIGSLIGIKELITNEVLK